MKRLNDVIKVADVNNNKQSGFTLIELMITVFIISLLAAIALPGYRQYIKKNTESQVVADMQQLSGQLNQWRAKYLSYSNFTPKSDYTDKTKNLITSPIGRDKPFYNITIQTVVGTTVSNITDATAANNWVMIATPVDTDADLNNYALTSSGVQCLSKSTITAQAVWTNGNCGMGGGNW